MQLIDLVVGEYHPKISRKQFRVVLHFKYVIYVQRNAQSYFLSKFWSIGRKLRYKLVRNKTAEIMEEVCEVGPKNLWKNPQVEERFSARNVSCFFSLCRKSLVMSTPKSDNFMQLFWTFVSVLVWPKCFFIRARNLDENCTKFIPSKSLNFLLVPFFIVLLAKSSKWRKYLLKFK